MDDITITVTVGDKYESSIGMCEFCDSPCSHTITFGGVVVEKEQPVCKTHAVEMLNSL